MVIGPRCQHVPAARAFEVVAGFTIINDVSARDWQWRTPTFTMGKSFDTHAPCGPELVTGDELGDPGALAIRTWVNDELRQDSTTADLIFGCAAMIEYLTTAFPLEPGTVIATGTPAGVGAGFDPPRFLAAGDTVRIAIEGIGELVNPVVQGGPPRAGRVGLSGQLARGLRHAGLRTRHNGGVTETPSVLSDAGAGRSPAEAPGDHGPHASRRAGRRRRPRAGAGRRRERGRRGPAPGSVQLLRHQLGHPLGRGRADPARAPALGDRGRRRPRRAR